ncbi:MAG: diaminopimelate epimerase [Phycisphaerales bacterium]|nr:diaminopimelate epimerase [Phycisphaerales bacterium]
MDATTLIPMSGSAMEDGGVAPGMTCVSMGNPHAVLFCRSVDTVPLEALGPHIARQPIFPSGVNVHFAQVVSPDRLRVRTWERGSGATLACGTGACAVLVAAALTGRARREGAVDLPGGTLHVRWDRATDHVFLTGPAADVCTGHWPLSAPTPLTPIPTLTTDRLTLRSLTQDDAAAVAALAADKRISDTTLTVPYPYLPHHASSWISTHAAGHSAGFNTVWGILDRRTGHVVGTVGIVCNTRHNTAEIGYWIGVPFWNRGYASEAAGAVLRWAFTQREPALQRIDAHHFIGNEASGRVMAKMGMLYEGLCLAAARKQGKAVDVARYAITREQWLGRSARADGVPAAKTSRQ